MKYSDKYHCYLYFDPPSSIDERHIAGFDSRESRHRLEVIKIYKWISNKGLKEAKDYVDQYLCDNKLMMELTMDDIHVINSRIRDGAYMSIHLDFKFDGINKIREQQINKIINEGS